MIERLAGYRIRMSIALIVFMHCLPFAQYSPENFIRYTSKDGLSDHYVTSIQQDSFGFIWIGTENGLNRFDGYSFKNYFFDYPSGFLASSIIRKLKLFNQHELGIVSNGGFQILDPLSMQVRNFFIPDSTSFVALRNAASDVVKINDQYGLTTSSGFYVFNADGTIDFRYDAYDISDYGNHPVRYGRQVFKPGNDILIYNESRGLAYFNPVSNIYTQVDSNNLQWRPFLHPVGGGAIHWITKAQVGENEFIFLSAQDSFIYYDSKMHKRKSSPLPFHWEKEFAWSSQIIPVDDTLLIITGAYSGFYFLKLNNATGEIQFDPNKLISDYQVLSLFKDREERIWIGTKTGLLRQIINEPFIEKFTWPDPSDRSYGFTDAIIHDSILYLSRQNPKSGLIAIDIKTMQLLKEFNFGVAKQNIIYSMEMYHPDTIWMGTAEDMLWLDTKSWNFGKIVDEIIRDTDFNFTVLGPPDKSGTAWMLLQLNGSVCRYNLNTGDYKIINEQTNPQVPFLMMKNLAYDSFQDVWFSGHSLARWDNETMQFDTLIKVYGGSNKFNEDILAMVADDAGSLWLHNAENGLLQYRIEEKTFRQFTMKDGLPTNTIIALSPVVNGFLFLLTPHHLVRLDTRQFGIEIFGNESDLPEEVSMTRNMYWDEAGKRMYGFYKNEIVRFPLERPSSGSEGNDIIVQELEINNEQKIFYPGNQIKLKHSENTLAIHYTIIDFEQSNDYQFAYNLDHAREWTSVASQRVIHITDLPPGQHHLEIRATGKSGRQKVSQFDFTIQRPFWNQAWFFPFLAVLISAFIYLIFREREKRIKEKANLDNQIAVAEMKALHAQMNPHFIFNSLNSIKEMVLQNDIKEASRYLSDFAHLIRMTLDQSRTTFISLRSTMEYLHAYIKIEQIRKSNFTFHMDYDHSLDPDETMIPPMLIQPFIENSIWHGVDGHKNSINISVYFKAHEGSLLCVIEDDGIGIDKAKERKNGSKSSHHSVGINNIQTRIDLLNQKHHFKSKIEITDRHSNGNGIGTGTIVKILLPLEIQEA